MVAHTGFEPVISALRGQCPRPLDECATDKSLPKKGTDKYPSSLSCRSGKLKSYSRLRALLNRLHHMRHLNK